MFLTDKDGAVADAYAYMPFGRLLGHQGDSGQPFTFVGAWGVRQEGNAGSLYHMKMRCYNADTAAFLTRDPVWPILIEPSNLNPYQYAKSRQRSPRRRRDVQRSQDTIASLRGIVHA